MENNIQNYLDKNKIANRNPSHQGALTEMVGLRREYMNRIINNKLTPSVELGLKIKNALGVEKIEDVFLLE